MNNDNKPHEEEEDDDFPEYANEQNKELNEIVYHNIHPHRSKRRGNSSKTSIGRSMKRMIGLRSCPSI